MKKVLLLSLFLSLIFSCTKTEEQKKEDLNVKLKTAIMPYISSIYKDSCTIDSVGIARLDTVTEKKKMTMEYLVLSAKINEGMKLLESITKLVKAQKKISYLHGSMGSKDLQSFADEDVEKNMKRFNDTKNELNELMDSAEVLKNKIDKADSIKFLTYRVSGKVHYTLSKNNTAKEKQFFLIVNKDFKVVELEDFLKIP